jgi:hypothetical protein
MSPSLNPTIATICGAVLFTLTGCASVPDGPTVGELLAKGGRLVTKSEFVKTLPAKIHMKWPNGRGEEDLVLSADGKITGTGLTYSSKSTSPVEGKWTMADDGKLCSPKTFTAWGVSTNVCWYGYYVGNEAYGATSTDPSSKAMRVSATPKSGS